MNTAKRMTMSLFHSRTIANVLLEALRELFLIKPLLMCDYVDEDVLHPENKRKRIFINGNKNYRFEAKEYLFVLNDFSSPSIIHIMGIYYIVDDLPLTNVYIFSWYDRFFRIYLHNKPDINGFVSNLFDYNNETYVFCSIEEIRKDGSVKYDINFAFDIENGTFIEIYDINHYNLNGEYRFVEESTLKTLEKELRGKVILYMSEDIKKLNIPKLTLKRFRFRF